MTRLQEIPKYAGIYTDNLTFDISFETTKYNIKYETNGGTLYADDKDEQGRATELDNSVYEAGQSFQIFRFQARQARHFWDGVMMRTVQIMLPVQTDF